MQTSHVFRAWKWLLAHLVVAASIGYIATMLVARLFQAEPATLLKATTFGQRRGCIVTNDAVEPLTTESSLKR